MPTAVEVKHLVRLLVVHVGSIPAVWWRSPKYLREWLAGINWRGTGFIYRPHVVKLIQAHWGHVCSLAAECLWPWFLSTAVWRVFFPLVDRTVLTYLFEGIRGSPQHIISLHLTLSAASTVPPLLVLSVPLILVSTTSLFVSSTSIFKRPSSSSQQLQNSANMVRLRPGANRTCTNMLPSNKSRQENCSLMLNDPSLSSSDGVLPSNRSIVEITQSFFFL